MHEFVSLMVEDVLQQLHEECTFMCLHVPTAASAQHSFLTTDFGRSPKR